MEMNENWDKDLSKLGIIYQDFKDRIIFYDPKEHPDYVVVRQHTKFNNRHALTGLTQRIGKMSFEEYELNIESIKNKNYVFTKQRI